MPPAAPSVGDTVTWLSKQRDSAHRGIVLAIEGQRAGYKNPDAAARQARTRKCASFGGFVHGDEGMGCWRCGESRQDHR